MIKIPYQNKFLPYRPRRSTLIIFFICLSTLFQLSMASSYHLKTKIPMPTQLSPQVSSIFLITDTKLAITTQSTVNTSINIYSGPTYINLTKTTTLTPPPKQPPIITHNSDNILINNGTNINRTNVNLDKQYDSYQYYGNWYITAEFIIVPQQGLCPRLLYINRSSDQTRDYWYQDWRYCENQHADGYVVSVPENKQLLVFGRRAYVFVIYLGTMEIVQVISYNYVIGLEVFYDKLKSKSVVMVNFGARYRMLSLIENELKFEWICQAFDTNKVFSLTDANSGKSIFQTTLYSWQNLQNWTLALDFTSEDQRFYSNVIGILTTQQKFVTFSNKTVSIYTFNSANYHIQKQPISIKIDDFTFKTHSGVAFQDSHYMLVQTQIIEYHIGIARLNLQDNTVEGMKEINNESIYANCTNFGFLDDEVFVTACLVVVESTQQENTIMGYELRIINATDFTHFHTSIIPNTNASYSAKILTLPTWSYKFLVLIKTNNSYYNDDSSGIMYSYDKTTKTVSETGLTISTLSYQRIVPVSRYIVSFLPRSIKVEIMRVFTVDGLKLIKQYTGQPRQFNGYKQFYSQADIIITRNAQGMNTKQHKLYNFNKDNPEQWHQGGFYMQQFYNNWIIFPQNGFLFLHATSKYSELIKAVYNIKSLPIVDTYKISEYDDKAQVMGRTYLMVEGQVDVNGSKICGFGFYVYYKTVYRFTDTCQKPYQPPTLHPLDPEDKYYISQLDQCKFILASTKKHVILIYSVYNSQQSSQIIEIRLLYSQNLDIVWSTKIQRTIRLNVDYTDDGLLIIQSFVNGLKIMRIFQEESADGWRLTQIDVVDGIKQECLAFVGQDKNTANTSKLVYKTYSTRNTIQLLLPNTAITHLTLSQNCNKVALTHSNNTLQIYTITETNLNLIYQQQQKSQIKSMKFINDDHQIVLQFMSNELIIRDFVGSALLQFAPVVPANGNFQVQSSGKYAVSNDGKFMAYVRDFDTVVIVQNDGQGLVDQMKLAEGVVVTGLTFSNNNSLIVSGSNLELYVLDSTPCPQNYAKINLQCLCQKNFTEIGNLCLCSGNFTKIGDQCLCPQTFILRDIDCMCPQNSKINDNKCVCSQNFIKMGDQCICPQTFTKSDNKCFCQTGYIQQNTCKPCDIFCNECTASGLSCTTYSTVFYLLVIGGPILVTILIVGLVVCVVKKGGKMKKSQLTSQPTLLDSENSKTRNQGK